MSKSENKKLLKRAFLLKNQYNSLKNGKRTKKFSFNSGLCSNLKINDGKYYFNSCSEFSGNEYFPVPSKKGARKKYMSAANLYKGMYGKGRKLLLKHLINFFRMSLDER